MDASGDVSRIDAAEDVADAVLIDAPPQHGDDLPGGNGRVFPWEALAGRTWRKPWFLAGGLTSRNVARAVQASGATQVDVSSGVESEPGVKSPEMIASFLRASNVTP